MNKPAKWSLVSPEGDRRFALPPGKKLILGRETTCDLPILDVGVSRRHAELLATENGLEIRDLASRNGTYINGRRVVDAVAVAGDRLTFGGVVLVFAALEFSSRPVAAAAARFDGGSTQVQERAMPTPLQAVDAVAGRRLAQLVSLAQRLGRLGELQATLDRIVDDLFEAFPADRVAVLLRQSDGTFDTRVARDRQGGAIDRPVPRAIAQGVAEKQVALITHDASIDRRTAGESVLMQSVRSALAAPLLGDARVTLGVLYVDNLRDANAFTDADLDFLVAYAGIAAAAVERELAAARLRDAARVRENFERYFTPQLAEHIASAPGDVVLGGGRKPVVVLFSDIRGFTEIAETLAPDKMAEQLNEYFAAMVECIFRHNGALDKFIGDAVMAYWGAPVAAYDDADRAVRTALDMQEHLRTLNERWGAAGQPTLHVGIGINFGDAFVGNIGSPRRLEYTLIGDTVNIASRLCKLARGGEVLVSEAVRAELRRQFFMRARPELLPQRYQGPPVNVFSMVTAHDADTVEMLVNAPQKLRERTDASDKTGA
ncbi:MAG: FHA domain-containing protein [Gemmatimonadota bacterium]|nr:FHA domain-containing protein [Gemmatimonadota bacterium]